MSMRRLTGNLPSHRATVRHRAGGGIARQSLARRGIPPIPAPTMLTLTDNLHVFLALEPCDMRKSLDELHAEVVNRLGEDPRGRAVFVFINRSKNLLKLLHWDGPDLWVQAKRRERGTCR